MLARMKKLFTLAFVLSMASQAWAGKHHRHVPKLSLDEAKAIALAKVPGKVKAQELEREHKRWIYSFEIRPDHGKKGYVKEVNVDADSGEIVEVDTERD